LSPPRKRPAGGAPSMARTRLSWAHPPTWAACRHPSKRSWMRLRTFNMLRSAGLERSRRVHQRRVPRRRQAEFAGPADDVRGSAPDLLSQSRSELREQPLLHQRGHPEPRQLHARHGRPGGHGSGRRRRSAILGHPQRGVPWAPRRRSRAGAFSGDGPCSAGQRCAAYRAAQIIRIPRGAAWLSSGESRANLSSSISCRRRCAVGVAVADID
jgi:hypothetical protein